MDALLERTAERVRRCVEGFTSAALTGDEKNAVTVALYSRYGSSYASWEENRELWKWEENWYERRLPAPPSRILVGACGGGREVLALARRGLQVDAFEPAPSLAAASRERLQDQARVLSFRYQDLSAAVLDGTGGPAAALACERYDAVLLGWGSLTHMLAPVGRQGQRRRAAVGLPRTGSGRRYC